MDMKYLIMSGNRNSADNNRILGYTDSEWEADEAVQALSEVGHIHDHIFWYAFVEEFNFASGDVQMWLKKKE